MKCYCVQASCHFTSPARAVALAQRRQLSGPPSSAAGALESTTLPAPSDVPASPSMGVPPSPLAAMAGERALRCAVLCCAVLKSRASSHRRGCVSAGGAQIIYPSPFLAPGHAVPVSSCFAPPAPLRPPCPVPGSRLDCRREEAGRAACSCAALTPLPSAPPCCSFAPRLPAGPRRGAGAGQPRAPGAAGCQPHAGIRLWPGAGGHAGGRHAARADALHAG